MNKFVVSAPAKAILFGEHAVVYGYPAIATTIKLHCYFTVTIKNETCENITLDLKDLSENSIHIPIKMVHSISIKTPVLDYAWKLVSDLFDCAYRDSPRSSSITASTCVIIYLFIRAMQLLGDKCNNQQCCPLLNGENAIYIEVHSEIPTGSGIGSSGAFSVAAATTVLLLTNTYPLLKIWDIDRTHCELISSLARDAERIIHGTSSGLDSTICTYGGTIVFWKDRLPSFRRINIPNVDAVKLLLVSTNITRSTSMAVKKVYDRWKEDKTYVNSIFKEIGIIVDEVSDILNQKHTWETCQSLISYIVKNQYLLKELGVSNSVSNELIEELREVGIPAKVTGAGFGGCVVGFISGAVYDDTKLNDLIKSWDKRSLWSKVVSIEATGVKYNSYF
ncbi:Mevalonate kinase [Schistosoma japonicum]|uniref:Mevalonate kinase n=1 Tax=Schistosoma japonicum TaxID=6182 RepID=A0A4Z2DGH8_SCHJA|nr:Mevalonate kinase [Schistosoma japonicum]